MTPHRLQTRRRYPFWNPRKNPLSDWLCSRSFARFDPIIRDRLIVRRQPVNQSWHHVIRQMIQKLRHRINSLFARRAPGHDDAFFRPARPMAAHQRNTKNRGREFLFGLQQAKWISARSDSKFNVLRKGRNDSIHLDPDDLSRELSAFVSPSCHQHTVDCGTRERKLR
jgi:hypothetical protein